MAILFMHFKARILLFLPRCYAAHLDDKIKIQNKHAWELIEIEIYESKISSESSFTHYYFLLNSQ